MLDLFKDSKVTRAITVTDGAAAATDIEGAILDMADFDSVMCILTMGAIVSGAVTSAEWHQDTAAAMGGAAALTGTKQTIADTDDEKVFLFNLHKPEERYVRLHVDRATQNATCHAVYVQYNAKKVPTTHAASVAGETHLQPAEGTA